MRLAHLVAASLLGGMLVSAPASADPPTPAADAASQPPSDADKAHARELFARGVALSKENRWPDALRAFDESARLYPHARTTFNLGYCERGLGHHTRAIAHFEQALAMDAAGESQLSEGQRTAAERYLREARSRTGRLVLVLPDGGASLSIDGRPLEARGAAQTPPLLWAGTRELGKPEPVAGDTLEVVADAGDHVLLIVAADGRSTTSDIMVIAGGSVRVTPTLAGPREPAPAPQPVIEVEPASSAPDDALQLVGAGVVGSLGVAGLVAGSVLAAQAASKSGDAAEACPNKPLCPNDDAYRLSHDARHLGNLATAGFVVGISGLACGAYLLLSAPSLGIGADQVALRLGPAAFVVRGRY